VEMDKKKYGMQRRHLQHLYRKGSESARTSLEISRRRRTTESIILY